MTTACEAIEEFEEDIEGEFEADMKEAKSILIELKRPKDREFGGMLMDRVMKLTAKSLEVKIYRNKFTKYLVKVLKKTLETQPKEYANWFKTRGQEDAPTETSLWSNDGRTFLATKTIPGFGLLVYMAVTNRPDLGWQNYGFLSYNFS